MLTRYNAEGMRFRLKCLKPISTISHKSKKISVLETLIFSSECKKSSKTNFNLCSSENVEGAVPKKRFNAVKDDHDALVESKKKSDELSKRREEELLQTIAAMQKRIEQLEGTSLLHLLTHLNKSTVRAWTLRSLRYHDGDFNENIKIEVG